MKSCRICGEMKDLGEFHRANGARDGRRGECKACFRQQAAARYKANPEPAKERVRRWAKDNPEKLAAWQRQYRASGKKAANSRRSHLKRTFGLTPGDYDQLLEAQGGGCAICGRQPRDDIALHIDHDRQSGRVRGLLCFRCNNSLGDLDDDPELLHRAVAYLTSGGQQLIPLRRGEHRLDAIIRERALALKGSVAS